MRRLEERRGRPTGGPGLSRRPSRIRREKHDGLDAREPAEHVSVSRRRVRRQRQHDDRGERDRRDAGSGQRGRSGWSRAIRTAPQQSPRCAAAASSLPATRGTPLDGSALPPRSPPSGLNERATTSIGTRGPGGRRLSSSRRRCTRPHRRAGPPEVAGCQTPDPLDPRASVPLDGPIAQTIRCSGRRGRRADGDAATNDPTRIVSARRESRPASPFPGR